MKVTGVRGYHILADLWGCSPTYLEEVGRLREILAKDSP